VTLRALTSEERQPTLFDLGIPEAGQALRLPAETAPRPSRIQDEQPVVRLRRLCDQLQQADTPLDRARVATEIRDKAEGLVAEEVRGANRGGLTWREIGAELGVPFQTLYRRYGGDERT